VQKTVSLVCCGVLEVLVAFPSGRMFERERGASVEVLGYLRCGWLPAVGMLEVRVCCRCDWIWPWLIANAGASVLFVTGSVASVDLTVECWRCSAVFGVGVFWVVPATRVPVNVTVERRRRESVFGVAAPIRWRCSAVFSADAVEPWRCWSIFLASIRWRC
jgi:hypothetical protein